MPMEIHFQRKRVFSMKSAESEPLDPGAYSRASDMQVGMVPDQDYLWLTVIQDTACHSIETRSCSVFSAPDPEEDVNRPSC